MTGQSFDVIIVGDFRFPGGTSSAVASEVRALRQGDHRVALYQLNSSILAEGRAWNDRIFALVEDGSAAVLPPDAAACCHVLFVHSPWLFVQPPEKQAQIKSGLRVLVTHHTPTDGNGHLNYDPAVVDRHAEQAFGGPFVWAPISPVCRNSFDRAGMPQPRLREDWSNVVFVGDWGQARSRLLGDRPVLGRHSRPQLEKWPATRADLLAGYPNDPDIEVRLLGVDDKARALFEPLPSNWTVWEFNEIPVKDFLAGIDFFVYFHRPDWIETFGLTIAEAAAAGCVVITHPYLEKTFGKAALYCSPENAPALVRKSAQDPRRFAELSAEGRKAIDDRFGPEVYLRRFRRLLAASQDPTFVTDLVVRPEPSARLWLRNCAKRSAYWSRHGFVPRWQKVLQTKAVRRPIRKIKKALKLA
jgi:hypothetical protein